MVHFELKCPDCKMKFAIDISNEKPFDFNGFACTECKRKGLILVYAELGTQKAVQASMKNLETRLAEVENYLADMTSTEEDPFEPADTN